MTGRFQAPRAYHDFRLFSYAHNRFPRPLFRRARWLVRPGGDWVPAFVAWLICWIVVSPDGADTAHGCEHTGRCAYADTDDDSFADTGGHAFAHSNGHAVPWSDFYPCRHAGGKSHAGSYHNANDPVNGSDPSGLNETSTAGSRTSKPVDMSGWDDSMKSLFDHAGMDSYHSGAPKAGTSGAAKHISWVTFGGEWSEADAENYKAKYDQESQDPDKKKQSDDMYGDADHHYIVVPDRNSGLLDGGANNFLIYRQFTVREELLYTLLGIAPAWSATVKLSPNQNAAKHAGDHLGEFPEYKNDAEYIKGAQDFVRNPPNGALTKMRGQDKLIYDPATNTFGVRAPSGAPRTMFRPTDGINYWNRQ